MASTIQDRLKKYFKKGAYPTEQQFAELIDAMRARGESILMSEITGLTGALNGKFDEVSGNTLRTLAQEHDERLETLELIVNGLGLKLAHFDDITTLPEDLSGKWVGNVRPNVGSYTSKIIYDTTRKRFITALQSVNAAPGNGWISQSIQFALPTIEEAEPLGVIDVDGVAPQHNTIYFCRTDSRSYISPNNSSLEPFTPSVADTDSPGLLSPESFRKLSDLPTAAELQESLDNIQTALPGGLLFFDEIDNTEAPQVSNASTNHPDKIVYLSTLNLFVASSGADYANNWPGANAYGTYEGGWSSPGGIKPNNTTLYFCRANGKTYYRSGNSLLPGINLSRFFNAGLKVNYIGAIEEVPEDKTILAGDPGLRPGYQRIVIYDTTRNKLLVKSTRVESRTVTYYAGDGLLGEVTATGTIPPSDCVYYSTQRAYIYDGNTMLPFAPELPGEATTEQSGLMSADDKRKLDSLPVDGVFNLGVVTSRATAFSMASSSIIVNDPKIRQIRWRTSNDTDDGGRGDGGTIFQERHGNWYVTQWIMFDGPNRVCKARTITTGGNYAVSEWQSLLLPTFLTYNMQTRMYRAVGLHNPNENPSEANATDMMQMPLADSTFAGMMSARDKSRLDELYDHYLNTK
ncbi:MAG: hypothetical protein HDR86_02850 [Bacteroides sp.]|nr:hypothetical protein [Bacteroides sp.]